jgi:phosphate starvation-inducible protein PhoH
VRHSLVGEIVDAYTKYDAQQQLAKFEKFEKFEKDRRRRDVTARSADGPEADQ